MASIPKDELADAIDAEVLRLTHGHESRSGVPALQGRQVSPRLGWIIAQGEWGSPKEFLAPIDPVAWDVVLVATWGSYDAEGFEEMHRQYADDFWARIQGKGSNEASA